MAVPSYNFLSGTGHRPFNNTLIGIGNNPFVSDATISNVLVRKQIHAKYNNANKTWVDLDAVRDDKPNLGFIRPLFSTTAEHGAAPEEGGGGGGGSATRNLKIGSTTINSIYLGSSQFTHVYIGSTLIWSQS